MQFDGCVPTVIARVIQQAILQRLQPAWDATFSTASYGFRPGRSAHEAVTAAQAHVAAGYEFAVDIDLAEFLYVASYCPQVSTRQVCAGKTNASEPLRTCRKRWNVAETRLQ